MDKALLISLDESAESFIIRLPGPGGGHHISVSCTEGGMHYIRSLLRARLTSKGEIGTSSSPTQEMVNEALKAWEGEVKRPAPKLSPYERKMQELLKEVNLPSITIKL